MEAAVTVSRVSAAEILALSSYAKGGFEAS
jgi:hypothetical protein